MYLGNDLEDQRRFRWNKSFMVVLLLLRDRCWCKAHSNPTLHLFFIFIDPFSIPSTTHWKRLEKDVKTGNEITFISQMDCPRFFKRQHKGMPMHERWIRRSIIYTSGFMKKYFCSGYFRSCFLAQRTDWEFLTSTCSSEKEHLRGWNVLIDGGARLISRSGTQRRKTRRKIRDWSEHYEGHRLFCGCGLRCENKAVRLHVKLSS